MFVFGLIVGLAVGIASVLLYNKFVKPKADKVVTDVKADLK